MVSTSCHGDIRLTPRITRPTKAEKNGRRAVSIPRIHVQDLECRMSIGARYLRVGCENFDYCMQRESIGIQAAQRLVPSILTYKLPAYTQDWVKGEGKTNTSQDKTNMYIHIILCLIERYDSTKDTD